MEAKREAGKEIELMGSEIETEMEMETPMEVQLRAIERTVHGMP